MLDDLWEGPLFKILAKNDTGSAKGKIGGFLVPKELRPYFPALNFALAADSTNIEAILEIEGLSPQTITTTYRYETWDNTRTPETRITGGLKAMLQESSTGDLLLIYRLLSDVSVYRFVLYKTGTKGFKESMALTGGQTWGRLKPSVIFVSNEETIRQVDILEAKLSSEFSCFDQFGSYSFQKRIARSRAFSIAVMNNYPACAFCDGGLVWKGRSELEAAHIISRSENGSDDPRNGLGLCRRDHWAFDNGLLTISPAFEVLVSPLAHGPRNTVLASLSGRPIKKPLVAGVQPHPDAIAWHRKHVYLEGA